MKRRIAFFDFDGTITTHDTLLEFIKFYRSPLSFYIGFALHMPWLIAYKAKLISNQSAKEKVLRYFFKGESKQLFQEKADAFAATLLPTLLRSKAVREIRKLKSAGVTVVVVSASAENWLQKWCAAEGLELVGTKLELSDNLLTGKIDGRNCHGQEKVARIKAAYDLAAYDDIYAYGDTTGDKPMLALASVSFYKPFR